MSRLARLLSGRPGLYRLLRRCATVVPVLLLGLTLLTTTGCQALAAAGAMTTTSVITPSYLGLKGQSIGIMAWADEATRFDHDMLILDITRGVAHKFQGAQARGAAELKDSSFPRDKSPDAIYAFQANHPDLVAEPIADVAPRLGVARLIYIEVGGIDLHSGAVLDLYRGTISATVKVVEVADGKGKVAFSSTVQASYPEKSPEEGMPNLTDQQTYLGTLDAFCTAVIQKFVTYPAK